MVKKKDDGLYKVNANYKPPRFEPTAAYIKRMCEKIRAERSTQKIIRGTYDGTSDMPERLGIRVCRTGGGIGAMSRELFVDHVYKGGGD
jgi:hypothetical protein